MTETTGLFPPAGKAYIAKQDVKKGAPERAPVCSVQETGEDSQQRRPWIPETGHLKDGSKTGSTGELWLQWHDLSCTSSDSANWSVVAGKTKRGLRFYL